MRAFTKYEKVECANGAEAPAEKFLAEVKGDVLDRQVGESRRESGCPTAAEKSALGNWRSLIDNATESREHRADLSAGQERLFE